MTSAPCLSLPHGHAEEKLFSLLPAQELSTGRRPNSKEKEAKRKHPYDYCHIHSRLCGVTYKTPRAPRAAKRNPMAL
jgi:hypothetical protein